MSPENPHQNNAVAEDWLLIQSAVGDALRVSREEVTREPLPGCFALLLLRLAFAEFLHDFEREDAGGDQRDTLACIQEP